MKYINLLLCLLLIGCGGLTLQVAGKYYNGNQENSAAETKSTINAATSQPMIPAIIAEPTVAEPAFWGNEEIAAASVLGLAAITYGIRKFIKRKV